MNPQFSYRNNSLYIENVSLTDVAAKFGTPCYVYSRATLESNWRRYAAALEGCSHRLCYAAKANSNLAILSVLAGFGAGFDVVSEGELERVLRAGGIPATVVFSGVGKTAAEMRRALEIGIGCLNIESTSELLQLQEVASALGVRAPIALRVNPDVDPKTHAYIATGLKDSKFGIPIEQAASVCRLAASMPAISLCGLSCHIGSQLRDLDPYRQAARQLVSLADQLANSGLSIQHIDLGGGLGIAYRNDDGSREKANSIEDLVASLRTIINDRFDLWLEPGRSIVGDAGLLLTQVIYLKENENKRFAIVDAAMNDLLRPALYDAWHEIVPVTRDEACPVRRYEVVGPICESGDFLGTGRDLAITPGGLLAVLDAGAYGFAMASTYNSRPRAAEVMVDCDSCHLIRARESIEDLMRGETMLDRDR